MSKNAEYHSKKVVKETPIIEEESYRQELMEPQDMPIN